MHRYFFLLITFFSSYSFSSAQKVPVYQQLYEAYEQYKEPTINARRFKHSDLEPLILRLRQSPGFTVTPLGESIEGRIIYDVAWGQGETQVLLWSQMHGDEPTATMAGLDIFNFLQDNEALNNIRETLQKEITIHFIPMLNPDGAEVFERRNALDIDLNRDAERLECPESQLLKKIRDSLDADFGFNLHDQSTYYTAGLTDKPATISFLAPAYDYDKDMNRVRRRATKLIVLLNEALQRYIPGQVARYDDDFEPRAFGDNMQKWGTSTVLIESGGYLDDPEKQQIRKLNFMAILTGLYAIAEKDYRRSRLSRYDDIPENERYLYDLIVRKVQREKEGHRYTVDVAINHVEIDFDENQSFFYIGSIRDIGDMSTYHGYKEFDAEGMVAVPGKIYPEVQADMEAVQALDAKALMRQGYTTVEVRNLKGYEAAMQHLELDITSKGAARDHHLLLGNRANFVLEQNGQPKYAVVNGFLYAL